MEIADTLRDFKALAHFDDEQRSRLAACAWRQGFENGAFVFRQGDPSRDPFAVLSGTVELYGDRGDPPFLLAVLGPGQLFGEANYIDHHGRGGNAVATEKCELLLFDADRLAAMARGDAAFELALLWAFWHSLSRKLRRANAHLDTFFVERAGSAPPLDVPARPHVDSQLDLAARRAVFVEQRLSPMEIHFLASLSSEAHYRDGEVIFREGDPGDNMYVVVEGRVMISKTVPGVGEEALAFLERGDYFGEMALIDHDTRSASAKAHDGDAVVLSIAQEVIDGLLSVDRAASSRLLRILCHLGATRLRAIDQKIMGWRLLADPDDAPVADFTV